MKKIISSISAITFIGSLLVSCGDSTEKKTSENKPEKDTLTVEQKAEPEEKPVVSLTKKEAEERMKAFLKENRRKYSDYGEFQDMDLIGGNYTTDGATDYFYSVNFYPGGDYVYTTHFFYESEQDKIRELSINKATDFMKSIDVKEITEGKLIGSADLWSAFSGEHSASRSVNAEFTIEGSKICYDKKYLPKFKKAEKEISNELDQIQQEMMENADGVNSSEDADY
jgi:hypothetical protein